MQEYPAPNSIDARNEHPGFLDTSSPAIAELPPIPVSLSAQPPQQENQLFTISDTTEVQPPDKQDPTIPTVSQAPSEVAEHTQNHAVAGTAGSAAGANSDELPPTESHTTATTPPLGATAPSRPFPPPGTLVVVQGVVHTTDVPRPNVQGTNIGTAGDGASTEQGRTQPRPMFQERGATNNRRSGTPPQPHSAGAAASEGESHTAADASLQINPDHHDASDVTVGNAAHTTQGAGASSSPSPNGVNSDEYPSTTNEPGQNSALLPSLPVVDEQRNANRSDTEESNPPGAISSSSIDVLGTLLSVAAAATAASLLTGSSEPILPTNQSPNLMNNQGGPATTTPTNPSTNVTGPPDFSAASRAERMRNAWASIRERLGIRPPSSSDNIVPSPNVANESATQPTTDTREMMLSEMARAFSVGLGLGGFTGPTPTANNNILGRSVEPPATPDVRPSAAEGSFERFLMELQADLRVALTTGEGGSGVRAMVAGAGWSDAISATHERAQDNVELQSEVTNGDDGAPTNREPEDAFGIVTSEEASLESPRQRVSGGRNQRQTSEPGRVNWWRLYRFPAIGIPRNNNAASAAAAALSTGGSSSAPLSSTVIESQSPSDAPVSGSPILEPASTPTSAPSSTGTAQDGSVVPVIIVGLQSVHMDWRHGNENHEADTNSTHNSDINSDVDDGVNDLFGPEHDSNADQSTGSTLSQTPEVEEVNQRRGARWRSRAADALRNLRSRRGGEQRNGIVNGDAAPHLMHQMPPIGPGSRMFLIYVIGGYYPPNHSIVLGNPADLESFEALSELAELLGQVKPPTASKEDIERSGLQVIKATMVSQYEREGKITSNCAERCLICLDDYLPEDDVRLMSCRHAFHKDCVDKWLQTGKNNCPACRTRVCLFGPSFIVA